MYGTKRIRERKIRKGVSGGEKIKRADERKKCFLMWKGEEEMEIWSSIGE